jgi:hypothetical protein
MLELSLGLGIVSWRSHDTLRSTLEAHRAANLTQAVDQSMIWFQDLDDADRAIAKEFGYQVAGGPNCGIAEGMAKIAETLETDLVLFLENDCPTVEPAEELRAQLERARRLFASDDLDILRLRHRWMPGNDFQFQKYLSFHPPVALHPEFDQHSQLEAVPSSPTAAIRRFLRPAKAAHLCGRAIYLEEHPDKSQPGRIRRHPNEGEFYLTDSRYLNWTNQSVLTTRRSFLDTIMAHVRSHPSRRTSNGFQSPERPLNSSWWRQQRFRIGVGRGLFTHRRLDGSWRPKHHAYQAESNSA